MSISAGFVKGQSDNLPKIDALSMFAFLGKNSDFMGAEIRGVKSKRSGRESYGDNAVGYVQVKRENNLCTVKAVITPEHRLSNKGYQVTAVCNEDDEEVLSVQCESCAASLGGCKHAIAFLSWLHRRSEEPAVTETVCYWKKSKLSQVGKALKFVKGKDLAKRPVTQLCQASGSFLSAVLETSKDIGRMDTVLTKYSKEFSFDLSIHQISLSFFQTVQDSSSNANEFLLYCSTNITEAMCFEAAEKTTEQSHSKLWHELRYGRITASRAYEAAHCHTLNGSLVESILGASSLRDTKAMKRGKMLESEVRKLVEKKTAKNIKLCGFLTTIDHPIMGASPDGISDEFVLEIKCPSSEKAMNKYISGGIINEKYKAQIQLQMHFSKKQKGLFCVAKYNFETSKELFIISVDYDLDYCTKLIDQCTIFWKNAIFPVLQKAN